MDPSTEPSAKASRGLTGMLESSKPHNKPFKDYKRFIQGHYDGFAGALTAVTGLITGHEALAGRLIRPGAFDVRGCKRILDAACGNGRYSKFLLKHADPDALLTSFDLSPKMLERARARLRSPRVTHAVADLTRLPYADATFDAVVCGWVLEHLPDPMPGLRELARVMTPGGKLLLLCTEDTLTGAMCSRLWHCRTYNRKELREKCQACGLRWEKEHWFSGLHRLLRLGGILVELRREPQVA
jgi:SAM-dependent methyltransferase